MVNKSMRIFLVSGLLFLWLQSAESSDGDRSDYFRSCLRICTSDFCSTATEWFVDDRPRGFVDKLVKWTCRDECSYECMWQAKDAFLDRGWRTPQFFGKWPFVRLWGMQEPASTIFSLLNLMANLYMIRKFRRKVRPDSPNFWVWHAFCGICCNAWVWSIVFHVRDLPVTELFDYGFAYSMVLASFVCMALRMTCGRSLLIRGLIAVSSVIFFLNHFYYLSLDKFDYQFNMKMNIITGILGGFGWLLWYLMSRKKRIYAWKVLAFQVLAAFSLILEVNDFPPLFYTFDAHSLWHLSTVPLTILFYNFVIDDCISLRKEAQELLLPAAAVQKTESKKSY